MSSENASLWALMIISFSAALISSGLNSPTMRLYRFALQLRKKRFTQAPTRVNLFQEENKVG